MILKQEKTHMKTPKIWTMMRKMTVMTILVIIILFIISNSISHITSTQLGNELDELSGEDSSESAFNPDLEEGQSDDSLFIKIPTSRRRRRRRLKKVKKNASSDEEELSDEEKFMIQKGNPLEKSEDQPITTKDFKWAKVYNRVTFPWLKDPPPPIESAGMKLVKKTEFFQKNPFQLLQLFIPIEWYETITAETNR